MENTLIEDIRRHAEQNVRTRFAVSGKWDELDAETLNKAVLSELHRILLEASEPYGKALADIAARQPPAPIFISAEMATALFVPHPSPTL